MATSKNPTVFIARRKATCDECKGGLERHARITLNEDQKALCLSCADLDHLNFLPAGNAALTGRCREHSTQVAVVIDRSFYRDQEPQRASGLPGRDGPHPPRRNGCDALVAQGYDRSVAREAISDNVNRVLNQWLA
jgi:hypothetical protein